MIFYKIYNYEFLISGQRQYMEKPKRTGGAVVGRGRPGRMGASPFPWIQRHDLRINHIFVCTKCIII